MTEVTSASDRRADIAATPLSPAPGVDPSEERYRLALRAANDIIWDWDARTDASVWGGAMTAVLGHDPDDAARAPEGANAWWVNHLHPDDRARVIASYDAALSSGATEWAIDYRFRRADGSYAAIADRACIAHDATGAVTRVVGAMRDVSELAEREQEQRRLYESALESQRVAERTLDRLRRLQAITAALGEAKAESDVVTVIVEQACAALGAGGSIFGLVRRDPRGGEAMLEIVRAVGYPSQVTEEWNRFRLAEETPLSYVARTGTPLFFRSPEERAARFPEFVRRLPTYYASVAVLPVIVGHDLLGAIALRFESMQGFPAEDREFLLTVAQQCGHALVRARLYDAERAARSDAERANRAKMDFLATMSHELRTPLNAIAGYAELLEMEIRGPMNAQQHEDIARIQRSQRHLLALINDILHFAKIEAGTIEARPRTVQVRPLLASLEPLIAPQLRAKRMTFSWTCDDAALHLWADEDKVRQILVNLLANAVKFTPADGVVRIVAAAAETGVCFRVIDTGVGIAATDAERIFDPFVQLERGLANPVEGTGLGLAISRDLARAMRGDLTVASEVGVGSTFCLMLPMG